MIWLVVPLVMIGVLVVAYLCIGVSNVLIYEDEIETAFRRDCKPFKPNQLWMVKMMMILFWPYLNWEEEVFYYDYGRPECRRFRSI